MPQFGIDSVTVPGVVDGWTKLHDRFGKLPWRDLFQPAIFFANHGYPVPELIHDYWKASLPGLMQNPESQRVFLSGGTVPETGEIFRNPDIAQALTRIANDGESAFYKGAIAQAILKTSAQLGGTMSADDLAQYSAEWVEPISTRYRDWTVYELPPNGDGMAALEMLNIMEQFQPAPGGPHSAAELHTRIEAMKLALCRLKAYDGDPRFGNIPVKQLLSKEYAAKRASLIDPARANCAVAPGVLSGSDTTYLSVVDRDGNVLSFIQSNYAAFGSGVTVQGMDSRCRTAVGCFRSTRRRQTPSRTQAALSHDYSGVHGKRRSAHRLRHYGRHESTAGARAVCLECCGLQDEHPGRSGGATVYGQCKNWGATSLSSRASRPNPSNSLRKWGTSGGAQRVFGDDGARASRTPRQHD